MEEKLHKYQWICGTLRRSLGNKVSREFYRGNSSNWRRNGRIGPCSDDDNDDDDDDDNDDDDDVDDDDDYALILPFFSNIFIGHVLGFCRKSELLRNNRHHRVRTSIAEVLKHLGWKVHEEVHCISAADSNRRADIIAIDGVKDKAMVLDPTIRFERNLSQADEVNKEKQGIYDHAYLFSLLNITYLLVSGSSKYLRGKSKKDIRAIETVDGWRARYNNEIYELYKESDLEAHIRCQRLRWLGHVTRMETTRKVKIVFNNNPMEPD
ncbi:hypothetical protein ANN_02873 [Periplaneta americana]|uniref:Uncharacterized protein n=1 Tax=Periplaneta americana TaxID=6978 RepID=A0ABQ8TZZ0_PERAM|nr:hypothetical protein ANN_02873 [Periplaneta americana]